MFIFNVLGIENLMKFDPNIAKIAEFTVEKQFFSEFSSFFSVEIHLGNITSVGWFSHFVNFMFLKILIFFSPTLDSRFLKKYQN